MKKTIQIITMAVLIVVSVQEAQSADISISSVKRYIGVNTSPTSSSFDSNTEVTDYAVFAMEIDDGSGAVPFADLKITYAADYGGIGSDMLICRTSNSQGLTDDGTLTVFFKNTKTGGVGLTFEWYEIGSFDGSGDYLSGGKITDDILYTTFDIDWNQQVSMPQSQLKYYALNSPTTLLTADLVEVPGWVRVEDDNAIANITDPEVAVQFLVTNTATHVVNMGLQELKQTSFPAAILFVFEFRDPSQVLDDPTNPFTPIIYDPLSSGIDLRAYDTAEGVMVEFKAYDVESDGAIQLQQLNEKGEVVWSGSVDATVGPEFLARFLVPGLEQGQSCCFRVRDEVGNWWDANHVPVDSFNAEMVSATLTGITLSFDSASGVEYNVQWCTNLGGDWQTVKTITATAKETTVIVSSPEDTNTSGYFRIQAK